MREPSWVREAEQAETVRRTFRPLKPLLSTLVVGFCAALPAPGTPPDPAAMGRRFLAGLVIGALVTGAAHLIGRAWRAARRRPGSSG